MLFDSDAIFIFYPPQFSVFPDIPFAGFIILLEAFIYWVAQFWKRLSIGALSVHAGITATSLSSRRQDSPSPPLTFSLDTYLSRFQISSVKFTIYNHCKFTDEHEVITEFWWKFLYARCDFFYLFGLLKW